MSVIFLLYMENYVDIIEILMFVSNDKIVYQLLLNVISHLVLLTNYQTNSLSTNIQCHFSHLALLTNDQNNSSFWPLIKKGAKQWYEFIRNKVQESIY